MVMALLPTVGTHCCVSAIVFAMTISLAIEASPGVGDIHTNLEAFPAKIDMRRSIRRIESQDEGVCRF